MSRFVCTVLAGLLTVLLVGCVTVPTSGPVEHHTAQGQPVNPGVDIAPVPPTKGATPTLIVEGFLHAMATAQNGYEIARQYLTPTANRTWEPNSGVQIYAEGFPATVTGQSAVLVAPQLGELDGRGLYRARAGQIRHDFGLVEVDGEWRISHPPRGLLVSRYLFASTFQRAELYFTSSTGPWLIPDTRFVAKGSTVPQRLAEALLAGPNPWLSPVIGAVAGRPMLEGISIDTNGIAEVVLGASAASLDDSAKERLACELTWTLGSLDRISGVRVKVGEQAWTIRSMDATGVMTPTAFAEFTPVIRAADQGPLVIRRGRIDRVNEAIPGAEYSRVAPGLTGVNSAAFRADGLQVAAVTDRHTVLRTSRLAGDETRAELKGKGLARPQYSRLGELWVSENDPRPKLRMLREGREQRVLLAGLPQGRLRSFRIAPDGVRIALVIEDGQASRVGVARITRTPDGVRVDGWQPLSATTGSGTERARVLDVGWADVTELVALVAVQGTTSVVSIDPAGVQVTDVGPNGLTNLVELSVAPRGPIVARTSQGAVFRYLGDFDWVTHLTAVDAVIYPG